MKKPNREHNMFSNVVSEKQLDPLFKQLRDQPTSAAARRLMNELWAEFTDIDGNFLEQWQTTAFDARTWEFFLFAYLSRSKYDLLRAYDRPDFIVERDGFKVAIEAVTTNPSPMFGIDARNPLANPFEGKDISEEEIREKQANELPIRFGSPLFSKLGKKYWELPQCRDIPLVFAIEAFHDSTALWFSSGSLAQYLYGLRPFPTWAKDGRLVVQNEPLDEHTVGLKIVPSNFFGQPGAENVSAILFGNVGTAAKFNRMAYQAGYDTEGAIAAMVRIGTCYDYDNQAHEPIAFEYEVSHREMPESWGEGLEIIHNPHAARPLPRQFFDNAADTYIEDGIQYTDIPLPFHPFASHTITMQLSPDD